MASDAAPKSSRWHQMAPPPEQDGTKWPQMAPPSQRGPDGSRWFQMSPDHYAELLSGEVVLPARAAALFNLLQGPLQIAPDDSRWDHVFQIGPDGLKKYFQMAPDDSRCPQITTWTCYPRGIVLPARAIAIVCCQVCSR